MKLSIILLTANPTEKQYAWKETLASYCALGDEVIIVNGGEEPIVSSDTKLRTIIKPDPPIWNWSEHAKNLNLALQEATGDWIMKVDIDWVLHEAHIAKLRRLLSSSSAEMFSVATMQKMTYYPKNRYVQKGEIPNLIQGSFKNRVVFGKDLDTYTDLTYPIFWDGKDKDEQGVPIGKLVTKKDWAKTGVEFWNFDYTFSTIENMKKKWLRMSNSHKEYFGETTWGTTEEEAFTKFMDNMRGKWSRGLDITDISMLPKFIRSRIENLQPEEFGYNGWGLL